jgi:hypothetical protein
MGFVIPFWLVSHHPYKDGGVGRTIEIGPLVLCKVIRPFISTFHLFWQDVRFLLVRITSRDIVVPSSILYQYLFRNCPFTRQTAELMGIGNEVSPNISIR